MTTQPSHAGLGYDFWLFRLGQAISVVGDSCGAIALAWWILEATGSAVVMSSVLAEAAGYLEALYPHAFAAETTQDRSC